VEVIVRLHQSITVVYVAHNSDNFIVLVLSEQSISNGIYVQSVNSKAGNPYLVDLYITVVTVYEVVV